MHRGRQDRAGLDDLVKREPVLPRLDRLTRDQRGEFARRFGVPHGDRRYGRQLRRLEEGRPVDPRRLGGEIGLSPRLDLRRVFGLDDGRLRRRDLGLEIVHALGPRVAIVEPGAGQHFGDERTVGVTDLGHFWRRRQIIIAVGQAKPALQQIGHILRRIGQRRRDEHAEQIFGLQVGRVQWIDVGADGRSDRRRQRALVGDRLVAGDVGLERGQGALVDPGLVAERRGIVGDQPLVRSRLGVALREVREQPVHPLFERLLGDVEGADRRAISRNLGGLDPIAVGVGEEIVARLDRPVHCLEVEARRIGGARLDLRVGGGAIAGGGAEGNAGAANQQGDDFQAHVETLQFCCAQAGPATPPLCKKHRGG